MLPSVERPPSATTILDLQHEFLPDNFGRAELRTGGSRTGPPRRSQIVVAISEHARRTLIERMDLDPERVRTIHLGVDTAVFTPSDVPREPFLLYPANAWPHKNHATLLRALDRLEEYRLVLTGSGLERLPPHPRVDVAGRVAREELVSLYRRASALVFPSLYEGFGQPVLEALACACPVACSDLPPLREVAGDDAVYFDPRDPESIADATRAAIARGGASGPTALRISWDDARDGTTPSTASSPFEARPAAVRARRRRAARRAPRRRPSASTRAALRVRRVTDEAAQLCSSAHERLVDVHVRAPVEADAAERDLDELLHRVLLPVATTYPPPSSCCSISHIART